MLNNINSFILSCLILISFVGCKEKIHFHGKWKFEYIQNEIGEDLRKISEGDCMIINDDGNFNYQLQSADLQATGTWEVNTTNDTLTFTYIDPKPVVRSYVLSQPTRSELILFEKGINYAFKK